MAATPALGVVALDTGVAFSGDVTGKLAATAALGIVPPIRDMVVTSVDDYATLQFSIFGLGRVVDYEYALGRVGADGFVPMAPAEDSNDWRSAGATVPFIVIFGLDPGTYYAYVRAREDDGTYSEPSTAASIRVGASQSAGDLDTLGPTGELDTTARAQAIRSGSTSYIYSDVGQQLSEQDRIVDLDAVFTSIENIFITHQDERIFNLDVTANLRPLLFQRLSDETANEIRARSIRAIARWEPRVRVVNALSYVSVNRRQNGYDVDFVFNVEGFDDPRNYQAFVPRSV